MASQEEVAFWQRYELTKKHAQMFEASTDKQWNDTVFRKVAIGNILKVSYMTFSQRYMYNWVNQCGVVLSLNSNEDGDIISITLQVQDDEIVNIPYENEEDHEEEHESMGGYTNDHATHLQRLE